MSLSLMLMCGMHFVWIHERKGEGYRTLTSMLQYYTQNCYDNI